MEQQLSIGFGMSNSWAPMMLKAVAEALLIDDEEVRAEVVAYLKTEFLKQDGITDAQAASEAEHRYHSFIRKNHKYLLRATIIDPAPLFTSVSCPQNV